MLFTRAPRLTRPLLIILAGVLATAGLLIAGIQAGAAHAATARTTGATVKAGAGGPKPTIVLVHGAWADSGSWNAVTRILQADGYTVYAPPNPLQGLTYDAGTIADFLRVPISTQLKGISVGFFVRTTGTPRRVLDAIPVEAALARRVSHNPGLPDTKITVTQRHPARRFPAPPTITRGLRPNRNAR
jgi:hypothetical protein